jgi:hypothetical protein
VVLEVPRPFAAARPGAWEELDVRAADLAVEKGELDFDPPWVAFLIIFNTFEADLGLRVADVTVTPP